MKILILNFEEVEDGDDIFTLEYQDGDIDDADSYIREQCQGNYEVEFEFKGIYFYEDFISIALTHYFNDQYKALKNMVDRDKIDGLFEYHQKYRRSIKSTEIKTIVIEYAKKLLVSYKS